MEVALEMKNIMLRIGENGGRILYVLSLLGGQYKDIVWFTLFAIMNMAVNTILKVLIAQPRPRVVTEYGEWQGYGMPSGHSQFVAFILFYGLKKRPLWLTGVMSGFAMITWWQRIITRKHSILQVVVGILIGAILAHIAMSMRRALRK